MEENEKVFLTEREATKQYNENTHRKPTRKINPTLSWDTAMKFLKMRKLLIRCQREPKLVSLRIKSCDHVGLHDRAQKE